MLAADYIVDIGPGRRRARRAMLCAPGTPEQIMACQDSITGQYLSGQKEDPRARRSARAGQWAKSWRSAGRRENNLKNMDVDIPLGTSDLWSPAFPARARARSINEILYKASGSRAQPAPGPRPGSYDGIDGLEHLDKVINIDQSPIGRTPRSNPATYTGVFSDIRELFATDARRQSPWIWPRPLFLQCARAAAARPAPADGLIKIEMHFSAGHLCALRGVQRQTLQPGDAGSANTRAKTSTKCLDMTVEEALRVF